VFSGGLIVAASLILLAAALHDLAFRTVPNWMSLALAALATAEALLLGHVLASLAAGVLVFAGSAACWRRGWLGGGDVKLLAATAMIVPPAEIMALLVDVALAGGVLAVCYLVLGRMTPQPTGARPAGLLARIRRAEHFRIHRRAPIPYASAIAAGAFVVLLRP
jgi:prepilin peptidase CpaA